MDALTHSRARSIILWLIAAGLISSIAMAQIPQPSLEGIEPALAEQIKEAQQLIEDSEGQGLSEQSSAWGELGMLYQALEYDDDALAAYRQAQTLQPLDGRWPYLIGIILAARGETEGARLHFTAAITLMPSQTVAAWVRIARVLLDAGQAEQALSAAERALERDEGSAAALAVKGEALLDLGQAEAAAQALQAALTIEPRANRLRFPLAMAFRALDETQAMERELNQAGQVGVSPDDPVGSYLENHARGSRIHALRARRAFAAGDFDQAYALFLRALDFDPENADLWVNLGVTQASMNLIDDSMASLQRALEINPKQQAARIQLTEILRSQGQFEQALAILTANEAELNTFDEHVLLARTAREVDQLDLAADAYLEALTIDKDLAVWRETIGVLLSLGRYADIQTQATHPGLNAEGRLDVAQLTDALLAMETDPLATAELAADLSAFLFAQDDSLAHAELRARTLLAQQPDCRAAIRFLSELSERTDWSGEKAAGARGLALSLARQPRCQTNDDR